MRLKELRAEAGLSQKEFANAIGAAQNTVSQWETGTRRLDDQTICKIALFFGCSADYLLGLSDSKKITSLKELSEAKNNMYSLIDNLPDEQVIRLFEIVKAALAL
mgnify:FL=1